MARAVPTRTKVGYTVAAWVVALLIFFPILYTIITSPQDRAGGDRRLQPDPVVHLRELRGGAEPEQLHQAVHELGDPRGRLDHPRADRRHPGRLGDGLLADQAHQGRADVDALDQDDAGRRGAGADLPDVHLARAARHPSRHHHRADADQPADHHLDALHLLPRDPRRDPRGGAHGRRLALGRDLARADADGGAGHRLDAAPQHHPGLERVVLDHPADHDQRGAADRLHRQLLLARRACSGPSSRRPR